MSQIDDLILEQMQSGYHCSQMIMKLTLDIREIDEPFTMRAMGALGGGMACQRTCGTLTGGVCALSSYVPRGPGEPEPAEYKEMAKEFVEWFEKENGSIECGDIVELEREKRLQKCPGIIARAFEKLLEILESHGYDPYES